ISRPGDDDHPWGHERAETTATLILSFVIFYAGAQIAIKSVAEIFSFIKNPIQSKEISRLAIYAALILWLPIRLFLFSRNTFLSWLSMKRNF
ncbi:MAG: cation transporter, partial [Treponemataceae bacterium]|nr:cation transporter [Treponemataceae bacterium]